LLQNFFGVFALENPVVARVRSLILYVHVIFESVQTATHLDRVNNFIGFLSANVDDCQHRCVIRSNMNLEPWRACEPAFLVIPATAQICAASSLHVFREHEGFLIADLQRVCQPEQKPRLASVLREHVPRKRVKHPKDEKRVLLPIKIDVDVFIIFAKAISSCRCVGL
jgi:hypothetical protein